MTTTITLRPLGPDGKLEAGFTLADHPDKFQIKQDGPDLPEGDRMSKYAVNALYCAVGLQGELTITYAPSQSKPVPS